MKILLKKKKNFSKFKNSLLIGTNEINDWTLPSFTKKILNTVKRN